MKTGDRLLVLGLSVLSGLIALPIQAQVQADTTLPTPSRVERQGRDRLRITEGTQVDASLFHSFERFSVPSRGRVTFEVPSEIDTILTRVTGRSPSRIEGLIEVIDSAGSLSNADLFLMNPNGIEFGRNARLRLNGSFLATTADSIVLDDRTLFSARPSASPPLLTVSTPIGLQFGDTPGPITNRSFVNSGLRVPAGEAIALLGGEINLLGGLVIARAGQITLGSVETANRVALEPASIGWRFDYQDVERFGDIRLSRFALLDTSSARQRLDLSAGRIQIQGNQLQMTGASEIQSRTFGRPPGDAVEITVSTLDIDVYSLILTSTTSAAQAGDIVIQSDRIRLNEGGQIASLTQSLGQAGNIQIEAQERIAVRNGILLLDENRIERFTPSGIFSQVANVNVPGDGGNIAIATPQLQIVSGGQINTTTFGLGNAGDIRIQADVVEIFGSALNRDGSLFKDPELDLPIGSGIFTGTEEGALGDGGTLTITAQQLSLQNGSALQTGTLGAGDAGTLRVTATEFIEIQGRDQEGLFPTSLFAASGGIPRVTPGAVPTATGRGGDIVLRTDELRVLDGGAIAVGSLNPDPNAAQGAGNLQIRTQTIRLENQGFLLAETASGNGGNIELRATDLLLLRQASQISTTAGTEETGGDGGDININAQFILSVLQENNDITANAFEGQGGNVNITSESLLGIQFQPEQTPESDITASSQFGLDGEVVINTLDIDPTQDVVQLPDEILDASRLARQACATDGAAQDASQSEFFVTGRGGVPDIPTDLRGSDAIQAPWTAIAPPSEPRLQTVAPVTHAAASIVEAQRWTRSHDGAIALVAATPHTTPGSLQEWLFHPMNCPQ